MIPTDAKKQRRLLNWIIYAEVILLVLVLCIFCVFEFSSFFGKHLFRKYYNPSNIQFYTTKDRQLRGKILQTLSNPVIKRDALLSWAALASTAVNTLSSSTYKTQLDKAFAEYFTKDGANALMRALEFQGVIGDIVAKKLSVTAIPRGPAVILTQGILLGHYTWKIQVPILVTNESLSDLVVSEQIVTLTIISIPTEDNPMGIGISNYSAQN